MRSHPRSTKIAILAMLVFGLLAGIAEAQALVDEREFAVPEDERFDTILLADLGEERIIDPSFVRDLDAAIDAALQYQRALLVLRIDSPGGRVDSARSAVAAIRAHRESERLRIIAWVPRQAISAAAWISLACRGLVIAPDALIGDIQPLTQDYYGYERAPEKVVTLLSQEVEVTCQGNGLADEYPRLFLEAMVDRDIEIVEVMNDRLGEVRFMRAEDWAAMTDESKRGLSPRFVNEPGKALTSNGRELLDYGFRVRVMKPPAEGIIDWIATPGATFERLDLDDSSPVNVNFEWSFLLLVAGVVLVVMELKTPGLGIFGLGGVAAFVFFFLVQSGWSDASLWPIGLFIVGAFLIILEAVILPGLILPGIAGFLLVLYSTYIGVAHPGTTELPGLPDLSRQDEKDAVLLWAGTIIGGLVGGFAVTITLGRMLHRLPVLNLLVQMPPAAAAAKGKTADSTPTGTGWTRLQIGDRGQTVTALRPSGVVKFPSGKIDVVTSGGFIEADVAVRVVEVSGNRVVVRALEEQA